MVFLINSYSLWGVLHAVMFNIVLFFAFVSHFRAMVTDPGIVPISRKGCVNLPLLSNDLFNDYLTFSSI